MPRLHKLLVKHGFKVVTFQMHSRFENNMQFSNTMVIVIRSSRWSLIYLYQLLRWLWCWWMSTWATMSCCFLRFFQLLDSFIMSFEDNFYLTHIVHQFSPFIEWNAKLRNRFCVFWGVSQGVGWLICNDFWLGWLCRNNYWRLRYRKCWINYKTFS